MAANIDAKRSEMYDDLLREYSITAERRKTLSGQASNLLGFAGIIETILIAAIFTLATDPSARSLVIGSFFHYPILVLGGVGFFAYIFTAVFAIIAYHEPKWIPAPQFPVIHPDDLERSVNDYWTKFALNYDRLDAAKQLAKGIEYDQQVNDQKYNDLRIASTTLVIGIFASTIAGVLFLLMSL